MFNADVLSIETCPATKSYPAELVITTLELLVALIIFKPVIALLNPLLEYPLKIKVSLVLLALKEIPPVMDEPLLIVRLLKALVGKVPPKLMASPDEELIVPELVILAAPETLMPFAPVPDAEIVPLLVMPTVLRVLVILIPCAVLPDVVMAPELLTELVPATELNSIP